jgi:superfamily I DNA/RNA helicase
LYYVAITRARDQLYVTSPAVLLVGGKLTELPPSRFIGESEIPLTGEAPKIDGDVEVLEEVPA